MRNYSFYIEEAKKKQGFKYNNQIENALGFKGSMMAIIQKGKGHLSEEKMLELADLAGVDKEIALLDLNMMRASGTAQKTYAGILQKLTQTTAAIAILAATTFSATTANASTKTEHANIYENTNIYYQTNILC